MKKFSDLKDSEQTIVGNSIDANASSIGLEHYVATWGMVKNTKFGLCGDCKNLNYAKSEFKIIVSECSRFDIKLNEGEKIIECTDYEQRNSLTLNEMKDIAYLIDIKKDEIGF